MSKRRDRVRLDGSSNVNQFTSQQAGDFLFDAGKPPTKKKDLEKYNAELLDQKTRVIGKDVMSALTFYDILDFGFNSKAARVVGGVLKRLLIGKDGMGRDEARIILTGNLPREIEIETGIA